MPPVEHLDLFVAVIYNSWSVWDGWGNYHDEIAMEKVLALFVLALYDLLVFSSGQYSFARCWLI